MVELRVPRAVSKQNRRIVVAGLVKMHRPQQKVTGMLFRKAANNIPVSLIGEEWARRGRFGPDEKVRVDRESGLRQGDMKVENARFVLGIAFFADRHVSLNGGDAQTLRRGRRLRQSPDTVDKDERDQRDRQIEIVVRPELVPGQFQP